MTHYCIQAHLSFLGNKNPKIMCNPDVDMSSLSDTKINIERIKVVQVT